MRPIDADALIPKLRFILEAEHQIYGKESWGFASKCINAIEDAPTVQLKQKTGEWIDTGSGQECSECGEIQYGYDNGRHFCANCGADMWGKEDELQI